MLNLAKKLRALIAVGFIACTGIAIGCSNEKTNSGAQELLNVSLASFMRLITKSFTSIGRRNSVRAKSC